MSKPPRLTDNQRLRLQGYRDRMPHQGPETVHIDITNTCNLDCVTCWNYAPGLHTSKDTAWKNQRMDAADFQRTVSEVAACGAERIILSGSGEPFTHPRIRDFIAIVKSHGLALTIITNGTLCDFTTLAEMGVDQLLVNMSSASAESYVAFHPNQPPETFHRLVEEIAAVRGRIGINLVQVINALNAAELLDMVELAHRVGARLSCKLGDTPPGTEACRLSADQHRTLLKHDIPATKQRADALGVKHNLDAFAAQLAGADHGHTPLPCFAGYLYSRVFVDGRIFFCCEHIEAGHMDAGDFAAQWHGPAYAALRQRLHEGRGYPGCARCGKHDMNYSANRQFAVLEAEAP